MNLIQGETQITREFDERQAIKVRAIIESLVATATDGSGNQPFCHVETDRLYLQHSALCDRTAVHRRTSRPHRRLRVHLGRLIKESHFITGIPLLLLKTSPGRETLYESRE